MEQDSKQPLLAFALVANVFDDDHGGVVEGKVYQGTRMFAAGKRVYLGQPYLGAGYTIHVIGMRRISKDFVNCVIRSSYLTNLRIATIYSQGLLDRLQKLEATLYDSRASAELAMSTIKKYMLGHLEHEVFRPIEND